MKLPPRYKERINPKTKKKEYKKRFRFVDVNGDNKDTDTKWHLTIEECEKEAQAKIEECSHKDYDTLRKLKLIDVFKEYCDYLKANAIKKTNYKNTTAVSNSKVANNIYKNYIPKSIQKISIKDLDASDFKKWMFWINDDTTGEHETIGGNSVRNLKRGLLGFNDYLNNRGYIDDIENINNSAGINKVKLRPKEEGKRKDRNFPKYENFKTIVHYYRQSRDGSFISFYWYTLFTVLYYTGMRVGELIALEWRDIDFNAENGFGVISIDDAIAEIEDREAVLKRIEARNREPKNRASRRKITIWKCYRDLLRDYRNSYKFHFGLTENEMKFKFVFPNITSRTNKLDFQYHKNILREIDRTIIKIRKIDPDFDLPKTDSQMFRHATAYLLAYEKGISVESCHDYFGHQDSDMINEVYAKLNAEERMRKVNRSLTELISEEPTEYLEENNLVLNSMKDGEELNKLIKKSRNNREYEQIRRAIKKGQEEYKYLPEYEPLIKAFINKFPDEAKKIKFIKD